MKKLFSIASLLALVMVSGISCQKGISENSSNKYPILFRCSSATRAVSTLDSIKTNGFDVYAYFNAATGNSMDFAKEVYYDVDNSIWAYDELEYWVPGATYWFKAVYYPKAITYSVDNTTKNQNLTISDIDICDQDDILVATSGDLLVDKATGAPSGGSAVSLNFDHIFACVSVEIKSDINVTINDISLKMVPITATYTNGSWTSSKQGNINKLDVNIALSSASNDYTDVTDGGFLVVPGQVNGYELHINTSDKDYEIAIPSINWAANTKYTYTLTIKQNDILFKEPSVEEWDEENAVGSVIIK